MFADVDSFLRSQGFQFHTFLGFGSRAFKTAHRKNNLIAGFRQCADAIAIYVRDWMRLEDLSDAKLRNYAILVHDLFSAKPPFRTQRTRGSSRQTRGLTSLSPTCNG